MVDQEKVIEYSKDSGRLATADLKSIFTQRDVASPVQDALKMVDGPYHTFSPEFQTGRLLNDVEFRVLRTGLGALAADTVSVSYLGPPSQ